MEEDNELVKYVHVKKKAMLEALEDTLGVVTPACKIAGIARTTHYNWLNEDPEYKEAVDLLQEVALDFTEEALYDRIRSRDTTAIIFHLKTKGRHRGYVERKEIAHEVEKIDIIERKIEDLDVD